MSIFLFQSPVKIIYGLGAVNKLGKETSKLGKKALIVTGKSSSQKSGALHKVLDSLKEENLEYFVFDKIGSDPTVEMVEEGLEVAKQEGIDVIIALGGGSPMDAAKGISIMVNNPGNISDYEKMSPTIAGVPIIAIPTTAGTGSEVTKFTVITDEKRKRKMLIGGETLIPKIAILDAELTKTMPPQVTAATGMDALTHAIEAYISKVAQPMSEIFALKAIKLISQNIVKAVLNGENMEARENMLLGQLYAGLAFSNASVALVHAMSRPLGAYFKVPHGVANAILLPKIMEYNHSAIPEKFKVLAEIMGENTASLSVRDSSKLAVKAINNIYDEIGLPKKLSDLGVTKESIDNLAEDAFASGSTLNNPRKASIEDIKSIYIEIY